MTRGRFITLEGGEGAGKSTQAGRLVALLEARGRRVVSTREPGGTPGAEEIRALLVTGAPGRWDAWSEALLVHAARRDHVERLIEPALARGDWVVCDRFLDSTVAYQGFARGLGAGAIEALHGLVFGRLRPDLTLIFDLEPAEGLRRAAARRGGEGRFEAQDLAFHQRLRAGFQTIAEAEPARCRVIEAGRPPEAVAKAVEQAVLQRFEGEL